MRECFHCLAGTIVCGSGSPCEWPAFFDELMGQLREQGIDDVSKVRKAYMEKDGRISVIEHEQQRHDKRARKMT